MIEKSPYNSLKEWRESDISAYYKAVNMGWVGELCKRFGWKYTYKSRIRWTKKLVIESASQFPNRTQWSKGCQSSYQAARNNGWLDEASVHMEFDENRKPYGYWNKKNVFRDAKKHKSYVKWKTTSYVPYQIAKDNDWLDECTAHMIDDLPKPKGYWDIKENVINSTKPYKLKSKWSDGCKTAYNKAISYGWMDEICEIKKWKTYRKHVKWTLDLLLDTIGDSTNIKEWQTNLDKLGYSGNQAIKMSKKIGGKEACLKIINKNKTLKKQYQDADILNKINESIEKYKTYKDWVKENKKLHNFTIKEAMVVEVKRKFKKLGHNLIEGGIRRAKQTKKREYPHGYWTKKDNVLAAAKFSYNYKAFTINFNAAYQIARKRNWLDEIKELYK